jgi:hypothetical protein
VLGHGKQPIEQRRGRHRVAKDVAPFCEAAIGGEDHGAALIASVDELEEQIAAAGDDGQVSDFVDDKQRHRKRIRSRNCPSRSALARAPMMSARLTK